MDNARRFKKKGCGNIKEQREIIVELGATDNSNKQLEWTTEMKIDLVTIDKEERTRGRGFMKSKGKMGPKVSRIPTSKLAKTQR